MPKRFRSKEVDGKVYLEVYNGSDIGWTHVRVFNNKQDCSQYLENWVKGIVYGKV